MTITLSPEDVKKFTEACRDYSRRRVESFVKIAGRESAPIAGGIEWVKVVKEWSSENQEPFPNLYQVLGL